MEPIKVPSLAINYVHLYSRNLGGDRIHVLKAKSCTHLVKKERKKEKVTVEEKYSVDALNLYKIFKEAIPPKTAYSGKLTKMNDKEGEEIVAQDYADVTTDELLAIEKDLEQDLERVVVTDGAQETHLYTLVQEEEKEKPKDNPAK